MFARPRDLLQRALPGRLGITNHFLRQRALTTGTGLAEARLGSLRPSKPGGVFMRSGRCGSFSRWALCCLFIWAGCSPKENASTPTVPDDNWEDVCVDGDGDGFGFQCTA